MTRQEEIAGLAEKAGELVKDLESLKQKAGLYSAARDDLAKAREDLSHLIEETKGLAGQTHRILGTLSEIGAGKIFERLGSVEKQQKRLLVGVAVGFIVVVLIGVTILLRMK